MCMIDHDESASVYSSRYQVARKNHKCEECNRIINVGEKYLYVFGVWGGDARAFKTCSHCEKGMQILTRKCGGYMHGGIYEDLFEHVRDILPWSMTAARLVIGMRRKWQRFDMSGLMKPIEV